MKRYKNDDPMEKRQANELAIRILESNDEIIKNFSKRCEYRPGSILYRELHKDTFHKLAKEYDKRHSEINFDDIRIDSDSDDEFLEYDTR